MVEELDPLGSLVSNSTPDADFTMYIIRKRSGGLAVGGIGFSGALTDTDESSSGTGWCRAHEGKG